MSRQRLTREELEDQVQKILTAAFGTAFGSHKYSLAHCTEKELVNYISRATAEKLRGKNASLIRTLQCFWL